MSETGSSQSGTRLLKWSEPLWEVTDDPPGTLARFHSRLPEKYAFFEGHFPTYPVLAGAVQLHELVWPCLKQAFPDAGDPAGLSGVKFPARLAPGDPVCVTLRRKQGAWLVQFEVARDAVVCTRGSIELQPQEPSKGPVTEPSTGPGAGPAP